MMDDTSHEEEDDETKGLLSGTDDIHILNSDTDNAINTTASDTANDSDSFRQRGTLPRFRRNFLGLVISMLVLQRAEFGLLRFLESKYTQYGNQNTADHGGAGNDNGASDSSTSTVPVSVDMTATLYFVVGGIYLILAAAWLLYQSPATTYCTARTTRALCFKAAPSIFSIYALAAIGSQILSRYLGYPIYIRVALVLRCSLPVTMYLGQLVNHYRYPVVRYLQAALLSILAVIPLYVSPVNLQVRIGLPTRDTFPALAEIVMLGLALLLCTGFKLQWLERLFKARPRTTSTSSISSLSFTPDPYQYRSGRTTLLQVPVHAPLTCLQATFAVGTITYTLVLMQSLVVDNDTINLRPLSSASSWTTPWPILATLVVVAGILRGSSQYLIFKIIQDFGPIALVMSQLVHRVTFEVLEHFVLLIIGAISSSTALSDFDFLMARMFPLIGYGVSFYALVAYMSHSALKNVQQQWIYMHQYQHRQAQEEQGRIDDGQQIQAIKYGCVGEV